MTQGKNILWIGRSVNGVPIRLTRERWDHIIRPDGHPEMQPYYSFILETLEDPDLIQQGNDTSALVAVRLYPEIPGNQKYLMVVYRERSGYDGYIITAYLRKRPSTNRRIIWTL